MSNNLNDKFQEIMDEIIISNGIPNKTAPLDTISTTLLTKLEFILNTEIKDRLIKDNSQGWEQSNMFMQD